MVLQRSSHYQKNFLWLLLVLLPLLFFNCVSIKESPIRYGYGIFTMPGLQINNSKTSVHAVAGYSHINFKGGGGHNNFLQFGAEVRRELNKTSPNGLWVGGEITYLHISNTIDNSSVKPHASGFTIGPAIGYRFQFGKLPLNLYACPAFLHRGGFNTSGMTNSTGASGFLGRFAFDIPFMTWLTKKGR